MKTEEIEKAANYSEKETTGLFDKNGKEIFVGDKVRFKFYGQHYFTEKVFKTKDSFYPFDPSIRVEVGAYIEPKDCVVVRQVKIQ